MKIIYSLTFFLLITSGFKLSAQTNVTLHMSQQLGGEPFSYNAATQSPMGFAFNVTRLLYYISEIKVIHDGGLETPITDLYLLVDPAIDSVFELGSLSITSLEKIQFSIGVDPAHNHLDPSTYPNGHPLAPQNPSMHWGWTSGYRFIAIEGFAGADSNSMINNYQIHTIGDDNYRTISLDVTGDVINDSLAIHIQADYVHLLNEIDASGGVISHASTGPSKKVAENTRNVFSAEPTTGLVEPGVIGSFLISPNPTSDVSTIHYDLPGYKDLTFAVYDLTGRMIYLRKMDHQDTRFVIQTNWPSGIYVARMESNGKLLAFEKLVIQ